MALARAFTSRRNKRNDEFAPQRTFSTKNFTGHGASRTKISAPLELLSTTNMLSYNAPDIHTINSPSSDSGEDSHGSSPKSYRSPATSVESSSVGSRPGSTEENHLTQFFNASSRNNSTTRSSDGGHSADDAPKVPHRAPSHTASSHQALARQRSTKNIPPPNSIHGLQARNSAAMFSANVEENNAVSHPFGKELAQVNEVAEEFGIRESVVDEEEKILLEKGLMKFGAADYLAEIQDLCGGGVFEDMLLPMGNAWI